MVEGTLVATGIEVGRRLYGNLRSDSRLRVEACFWWTEGEECRLHIATPLAHEQGLLHIFRLGRQVLQEQGAPEDVKELFERTKFVSPSYSLIRVLDSGSGGKPPLNRWLDREGLGGVYVEGAYFYYFEPRTFMAVER